MVRHLYKDEQVDPDEIASKIRKILTKNKIRAIVTVCKLIKELIAKKPPVIIDMGYGFGLNLRIIRNYVDGLALLLGVDKDASALSIVKMLALEVDVIQANIYALPLRSNVV